MLKHILLILFLTMLTGCERCYEWHTVEITKISEYDGWNGEVHIGFEKSGFIVGSGTVSKGKLIVDIDEIEEDFSSAWRGSGSFPVAVQIGMWYFGEVFIYTDGKTFQELQIDICTVTNDVCAFLGLGDMYCLFSHSDFYDKLPKIKFRKPEEAWGKENITTTIEFNKFQKLDFTECEQN